MHVVQHEKNYFFFFFFFFFLNKFRNFGSALISDGTADATAVANKGPFPLLPRRLRTLCVFWNPAGREKPPNVRFPRVRVRALVME